MPEENVREKEITREVHAPIVFNDIVQNAC